MKIANIVSAAGLVVMLSASRIVCAESTNNAPIIVNGSDVAWNELQQAVHLPNSPTDPPTDIFEQQQAAKAMVAADNAKNFYTHFPNSTNVIAAKKLQCEMLETAYFSEYDTNVFSAWAAAQQTMLADPKLTDEDRFDLRVAILNRERFDPRLDWNTRQIEREKGIRELIKDYPKKDKLYEMLLNLAANSPDEKSRSIANKTLALPVSADIRTKAEGILRRLDAVGKPLDIKFTALDGTQVNLTQMKGKVVLVDFWATWCGPCVGEIPHVKEAYNQFHSQGFEVVGISFDSSWDSGKQRLQRFIQKKEMSWPEYFDGKDWRNKFGIQYGIASIPTMWLVDKNGNLRDTNARSDLKTKVKKLLAE